MSVYQRHRSLSSVEYYYKAIELYVEVCKVAVSRRIPKTHRFTISVPMANTAREMLHNIVIADSFHDNPEQQIYYFTLAYAECQQLFYDLQCIIELVTPEVASFESLIDKIDKESDLLESKCNKSLAKIAVAI